MNREELKVLNDEQLREILLAEFEASGANVNLIQTITDILREHHPENERDATDAYREFENEYVGTEPLFEDEGRQRPRLQRNHRRWKRVVVAVAAVLIALLGTTVVASAAGIDIWGIIRDWTQETFGFETRNTGTLIEQNEPNPIDAVNELLAENGMPTLEQLQIPDDYECVSTSAVESRRGNLISTELSNGKNSIMITVQEYDGEDASRYFPKDGMEPEVFSTIDGIDYYYSTNYEWQRIVWADGKVVVSVSISDLEIDYNQILKGK